MNDHIPPHRPQLQATVVPVQEYNKWPIDWNSLSTGKKKFIVLKHHGGLWDVMG